MNHAVFVHQAGANGNWRAWPTHQAPGHISVDGAADRVANTLIFRVMYGGTTVLASYNGSLSAGASVLVPNIGGRFTMSVGRAPGTGAWVLVLSYSFTSGGRIYPNEVVLTTL